MVAQVIFSCTKSWAVNDGSFISSSWVMTIVAPADKVENISVTEASKQMLEECSTMLRSVSRRR